MSMWRSITNTRTQMTIIPRAKWCAGFWCHLRGLMFRTHLPKEEALLFVTKRDSKAEAAIHMFFMFMDIAVIWINSSGQVVDKVLAKPWRPMYAPRDPAMYYIEAHPSILNEVEIGDVLQFHEV